VRLDHLLSSKTDFVPSGVLTSYLHSERDRARRAIGLRHNDGAIAQLGEHLLCKQGVVGSIPTGSTSRRSFCKSPHIPVRTFKGQAFWVCSSGG
jgi:hypothetical protein